MITPRTISEYIAGYANTIAPGETPPTLDELAQSVVDDEQWLKDALLENDKRTSEHHYVEIKHALRESGKRGVIVMPLSLLTRPFPIQGLYVEEREIEDARAQEREIRKGMAKQFMLDMHDMHAAVLEIEAKAKHPLAPIVKAWLKRPREVTPDKRDVSILAKPFGKLRDLSDVKALPVFAPEAALPTLNNPPPLQPMLMDIDIERLPLPTAPITLFDHAIGNARAAPLEARLCVELLLLLDHNGRTQTDGRPVALDTLTLGELGDWLYSSGFNVSRHFDAFMSALYRLNELTIMVKHSGIEQPLTPFSFFAHWKAIRSRRAKIDVSILLPPGSERGARIHKPTLRGLTDASVRLYRGHQTLAYVWETSARGGKVRRLQPSILKDADGRMLDAHGAVIVDEQGKPIKRYMRSNGQPDSRVLFLDADGQPAPFEHAAHVDNDIAWQYAKRLDAENLIDVFHARGARERATPVHQ